jgi:hypothetical protein
VGDEDEGDAELTLQRFQLVLHLLAQLVIQRRKGFIEQQQARFVDHRAGDGHALLLAAGELVRFALGKRLQLHHRRASSRGVISAAGVFCIRRPKATFSNTVICGNRA